jgi:phage-related protein
MQFGEAFLSLIPQLDQRAVSSVDAQAKQAGGSAGKSFSSSFDSSVNVVASMTKRGAEAGIAFGKSFEASVKTLTGKMTLGDDFAKKFEAGAKKVETSSRSFLTAGAAAGGLSAALISAAPAVGGLLAATAPAVGGMVALKAGMLAVKLTAKLVTLATQETADAIGEGLSGTAKEAEEALSALPPQAEAFARSVVALKKPIEEMKEQLGERLFAPINKNFGELANSYIPAVSKKLPDITGAVGEMASKFIEGANSGKLLGSVTGYIDNVSGSLKIAGANVGLIPDALAEVLSASGRTLPTMAQMIDKIIVSVANWVTKMGEAGKIDTFFQKGIATLQSFGQIIGNIIGIVTSVFSKMDTSGQTSLATIVKLTQAAEDWTKSAEGGNRIAEIWATMEKVGRQLGAAVGPIFPALGAAIVTALPVLVSLATTFSVLLKAVTPLLPFFTQIAAAISGALLPPIQKLAGFLAENEKVAKVLAVAIGALVVATKLYAVGTAAAAAATTAWTVVTRAAAIASNAWAVAVYIVNTAMKANPIGLVITAITALVAIIVIAYKNHEGFREIVDKVWAAIKTAISAVADWFVKTAWPAIKTAVEALGKAMEWLWNNAIKPAWDGIKVVIEVAWAAIKAIFDTGKTVIEAYGAVFTWLWKTIIEPAWNGIKALTTTWWAGMVVIFNAIKPALEAIGAVFTWLWKNLIVPVWDGIKAATTAWWTAVQAVFNLVISFLQVAFASAWNGFRLVIQTVFDAIKALITAWWSAVTIIFNAVITFLSTTFKAAWDTFKVLIDTVWTAIKTAISVAWEAIKVIFTTIITFLATTFKAAWDAFKLMLTTLWEAIKTMLMAAWVWIRDTVFTPVITFLATTFKAAWDAFKLMLTTLWEAIKTMLMAAWTWIRDTVFTPIMTFLSGTFKAAWDKFRADVNTVWEAVKNLLKSGWDWIKSNVFEPIASFITKDIPSAFDKGVNAIKTAWEKIQEVVKKPVKFVVDTVINGGIIKGFNWIASKVGADTIPNVSLGFARGGVLPGYTPGRDVHQFKGRAGTLNLSGGEAIMRPEWTRAMGSGFVNMMNGIARTRGVEGVRKTMGRMVGQPRYAAKRGVLANQRQRRGGFSDGGVMNFAEGGVVDFLKKAWDGFTDPVGTLKSTVSALTNQIPGGPFMKDVLKKTIDKLMDGLASFITTKFKAAGTAATANGGIAGPTGGGSGDKLVAFGKWLQSQGYSVSEHPAFGGVTSGGHTNGSRHYSGRAIDVNAGSGTSKAEQQKLAAIIDDAHRAGLRSIFMAPGHYNHAHFDYAKGGQFSPQAAGVFKYDQGGWFNPGQVGTNQLSQPEAVLTPDESRGLKNMGVGELAELLRELIDAVERIAPAVGTEINGVGSRLIVKNRMM